MVRGQLAEQIENVEYKYAVCSGEQIKQVSGVVKLHSIIINKGTSGQHFTVFDAVPMSNLFTSAGTVTVALGYCGSLIDNPKQINYDVELHSGLVVVTSGSQWNLTVTYKD